MAVLLGSGAVFAEGIRFRDDFDAFDESRWHKSDHRLGRSDLRPDHVRVGSSKLRIKLPADTLEGGEIASRDLYGYGTYTVRMRVPNAPSSITAFFLYEPPDFEREIDIEIYNDSSRRAILTTYSGGSLTNMTTVKLPFDPRKGFHTYRIEYRPKAVRYYADGVRLKHFNTGLPADPMRVLVNAWFPTWLSGKAPAEDKYAIVDWVAYRNF